MNLELRQFTFLELANKQKNMQEHQFNNRLRYVAFKRMIIVLEALLFVVLLGVIVYLQFPPPWFELLIAFQMTRIATEIINHVKLQDTFNVRDHWLIFPFI